MPFVAPLRPDDPRRVGRYRLAGRIEDDPAKPRSAASYLARLADGAAVSVTLLGADWAPDGASRDRFTAEAKAARRVAPFCAARILDAGFDADEPFLVSEFVEGPSLREVIEAEGSLAGAELTALAIGTATGLTAVHQAGLVHGEFGPDDVVFGADGPRLVHFNITPPYGSATPAADMFAWAQTMLLAAAGRPALGPQDLSLLPEPLRNTVSACLTADVISRPPARTVVTALLGRSDPAAGLLAEGARRARLAARGVARSTTQRRPDEMPARSRSRGAAWVTGCVACVLAIAGAATLIFTHRDGHADAVSDSASGGAAATATASVEPSAAPSVPVGLDGSWAGQVHQTDPVLETPVRIRLTVGSLIGQISYPALGCSGHLLIVSATADRLTLDQGISSGQQSCENGVVILAKQANGTLAFSFRRSSGPSPSGVLTKR